MSARFAILLAVVAMLACASRARVAQMPPSAGADSAARSSDAANGCEFSGPPKSTLAWESGLAQGRGPATRVPRNAIVGRVVAVRDGEPVVGARIRLDPGDHFTQTDSGGRFAFPPLPQGRYRVNVMSLEAGSVADSVTVGFDGLRIVAALTTYRGDIVCTVP
jgi:hypothetical protein